MPWWSVDVRDGQYRASRMRGDDQDRRRGKEGWFGREGQPPGPSITVTYLTQVGAIIRLGNDRRMTLMDLDGPRTNMVSQSWGVSLQLKKSQRSCDSGVCFSCGGAEFELGPALAPRAEWEPSSSFGCKVRAPRRRMRPAGISGPA